MTAPQMTAAEYHASERQSRIGASDVASVLGISPYRSAYELWLEKTGQLEPWAGNEATKLGTKAESILLDEAEEQLGQLDRGVLLWAPGSQLIAATLDGQVVRTRCPVECKTSGLTGGPVVGYWGDPGTDEIPDYYLVQVQMQIWCAGADLAHVKAWLGGRGIVDYQVHRSDAVIKAIADQCREWWERHIVGEVVPEMEAAPSLEVVKRIRRQPNKVVELSESEITLLEQFEAAQASEKTSEALVEDFKARLILSLGDAEMGTLPDGRSISYMTSTRRGYTVEETTFRTLRIKKGK